MGKLRIEPKSKIAMSNEKYAELRDILKRAWELADGSLIYWDMDKNENTVAVRRDFLNVAEQEQIPVKIRRLRKSRTLTFEFPSVEAKVPKRMTPDEALSRLETTLKQAKGPMDKKTLIKMSGIKQSTAGLRLSALVKAGKVRRIQKTSPQGKNAAFYEFVK